MAAPPAYGDNPQQQALIEILMQDNEDLAQRQDLVYDRRDMGNDDAAPLPDIDWRSRPSKAMTAAAASADKADELDKAMQFAHAPIKAAHKSDTWNRRIIDFYLVYCQFMATYTQVPFTDFFITETLVKYAIPYLVIRAIKTKGIDGDRIKARTLITWMDGLINGIWQYAHSSRNVRTSAAKEVLFQHGLARRIRAKVEQIIRVLGLSKIMRTKHILDLPDMLLIIDSALYNTRLSPGKRLAVIQFIMAWCIIMYTGLRPMSLAASNQRYLDMGFYMRLRNIKIIVNAASDWTVLINATELKGHVVGLDHKDLSFTLRSVKKTHNILFCAATWVVLFLWLRGAFPQYKTLRELWATTDSELVIKESMRNEPFLLAGKEGGQGLYPGRPATAKQITTSLSYHAHLVFLFDATAYALRRGLARLLERLIGSTFAAMVLAHKDAETVFQKHYAGGAADIDLVGLVTQEAGVQPEKPGMHIAATRHISRSLCALLNKRWWSKQVDASEGKAPVKAYGRNGENVVLTREQEQACKPVELEQLATTAFDKFWACFKRPSLRVRNTSNANALLAGITSGKYSLKPDVKLDDAKEFHAEAIKAQTSFTEAWKARKRAERKLIAQRWLAAMACRPVESVEEREAAAENLRRLNEAAIQRLVDAIPVDATESDIMSRAQMDATLEQAFEQETDDLDDVVDEHGRVNPLPRAVLNRKFATQADMTEMDAIFDKPFIVVTEQDEQAEDEQPLVMDADREDNGLDETNDLFPGEDIIAVRRELMELAAMPILCERDGRPIPGCNPCYCADCDKTFRDLWACREHMRWVHSDWQEYVKAAKAGTKWRCATCNRSWKKKGDFIDHALNNCSQKERNQAWYAQQQEYAEKNAAKAKERRQRLKTARASGPEAVEHLLKQVLPDGVSEHAREGFKSAFDALPSMLELDEALIALEETCAARSLATCELPSPAFDYDEAFTAYADFF